MTFRTDPSPGASTESSTLGMYAWHVTEMNSRGNGADRGVFRTLVVLDRLLVSEGYTRDDTQADPGDACWTRPPRPPAVRASNDPNSGIEVYAKRFQTDTWIDGKFDR